MDMSDGRVVSAYFLLIAIMALVFWLFVQSWVSMVIGGGIAILWWIIAGMFGDAILMKTTGAVPLNVAMYSDMGKLAKGLRISPRIGPPSMWFINDMSPMVMCVGLKKRNANLIFTKGFLENLEDKAQLGLVHREVEEIRSGMTAANTALAALLWFILLPGRIGTVLIGKKPGEPNVAATLLNLVPAFLLGWSCALVGFSKTRVHATDSATLKHLENPDYLPYALMKLQEILLRSPLDCDLSLSPCCVLNPKSRDPYQGLLKLHPTTPKRIDRLRIRAKASRLRFNR
jgi:hypothetical protein